MRKAVKVVRATALGLLLGLTGAFLLFQAAPRVSANDLPVQYVGNIDTNQTWTNDKVYYIQGNARVISATLTIEPGTIIKYAPNSTLQVEPGSTVQAAGTNSQPVIFTSYRDDSYGGDSNNDGPSSPDEYDYISAFYNAGGSIDLEFTKIQFGYYALSGVGCGSGVSVDVRSSVIKSTVSMSCGDNSVSGLTLARNMFDMTTKQPLELSNIDPSGVYLSGADQNIFTGSGKGRAVDVANATIPTGSEWVISGSSGAILLPDINVKGKLTLRDGAIVKDRRTWPNLHIHLNESGQLDAQGTVNNKVIFTSYDDDSIGGDTNGDGSASSPGEAFGAISVAGTATATIKHASFSNIQEALTLDCYAGLPSVELSDSSVRTTIFMQGCPTGSVSLKRNQFASPNTSKFVVSVLNSDPSGISLAGVDQNTFVGTGRQIAIDLLQARIPAGSVWDVAGSSGAVLAGSQVNLQQLKVEGTLNLQAGAIVKAMDAGGIAVDGSLTVEGQTTDIVEFTSIRDDGLGGDTDANGPSGGQGGPAIIANPGSTVNVNNAKLRNAAYGFELYSDARITNTTITDSNGAVRVWAGNVLFENVTINQVSEGLTVMGSSTVTYRGKILNVTNRAVNACNWEADCQVDVTYTDWGAASGPDITFNGKICGAALYSPWKYGGNTYESPNFGSNCNGTSPFADFDQSAQYFQNRVNTKQIDCSNGFQDACDQIETAMACLTGAVNTASSTSPFPLPQLSETGQLQSFQDDVRGNAAELMKQQAVATGITYGLAIGYKVIGKAMVGTFFALHSAYGSCAP